MTLCGAGRPSLVERMPVAYEVPRIQVLAIPAAQANADIVIVPVAEDHAPSVAEVFDPAVGGALVAALDRGEFRPRACETFSATVTAGDWSASRVLFVGGGPRAEIGPERFRRMAATALAAARQQRRARVAWVDAEPGSLQTPDRHQTAQALHGEVEERLRLAGA